MNDLDLKRHGVKGMKCDIRAKSGLIEEVSKSMNMMDSQLVCWRSVVKKCENKRAS